MPTLFYEIFNKVIKLDNEETIDKFLKEIEKLFEELKKQKNIDNLKVLRNKLEESIRYSKSRDIEKKIKKKIKKLDDVVEEIDEYIEDEIKAKESVELVDVVKEVEKSYKTCDKIPDSKKKAYVQACIKKSKIKYEKEIIRLQLELVKLQRYIKEKKKKVLIIFEGRDAAWKWGTIKRFTEYLNPRWARITALEKPTDLEKTQWYFQRYVTHLPNWWEIVFFDRSWYNRGWVEPVMGFVNPKDYEQFLEDVPKFEKMLSDSWTKIIKFYFSVSKEKQAARFEERKRNPLKQFKLSPVDQYSQQLWDKYTLAEYKNFSATHTKENPWVVINSDDKKKARINAIKYVLNQFNYTDKISDKKLEIDEKIVISGKKKANDLKNEIDTEADLFE